MNRHRLVFALAGDVHRNSRALKQLGVLAVMGFKIDVLSMGVQQESDIPGDITVHNLPQSKGSGPRLFWHIHCVFSRAVRRIDAEFYHASDLYVLPALVRAAEQTGARVLFDARELYPYVASTAGRPWVSLFWNLLQDRYIRRTDAVFTVSESIAQRLVAAHGIQQPVVLYNVPEYRPLERTNLLREHTGIDEGTVLFLHQGQMKKDRGCEKLVRVMASVRGAVLVFLGSGPLKPSLQRLVKQLGLKERVFFVDAVPPDVLLDYTSSADIGVTMLEDTCLNHRFALPNKLFEYLAAGLPVLASDLPEIAGVISGHGVGCVVDPQDEVGLSKVMQQMADDPESRVRWQERIPGVFETFNWSNASERLESVYRTLMQTGN